MYIAAGNVAQAGREGKQAAKEDAHHFADRTKKRAKKSVDDVATCAQDDSKGMVDKIKDSISDTTGKIQEKSKGIETIGIEN